MSFPDGRVYEGRLKRGKLEGLGMMTSVPSEIGEVDLSHGLWKDGLLHGLATIQSLLSPLTCPRGKEVRSRFVSGNVYEGFMREGKRCGHGVQRSSTKQCLYVGSWKDDLRHGYGVSASQSYTHSTPSRAAPIGEDKGWLEKTNTWACGARTGSTAWAAWSPSTAPSARAPSSAASSPSASFYSSSDPPY